MNGNNSNSDQDHWSKVDLDLTNSYVNVTIFKEKLDNV